MDNLSKNLKLAVTIFENAPFNTVSTIDLRIGGIYYPPQAIRGLRDAGAIITVVQKPAHNEAGELRPNIAHYHFEGWV